MAAAKGTLLQELWDQLLLHWRIKPHLTAAQPVLFIRKQAVQGNHHVVSGEIGCDVIRVADADIGGGPGGNIGYDIVIYFPVIRVQPQVYRDVGIELLKILNRLFINIRLPLIGIVFRPKGNLMLLCGIKGLRHRKVRVFPGTMTAGKQERGDCQHSRGKRTRPALLK